MLTKGDDYPIHQTAEPIAFAGSDRNFYDRYFFNGYSADGELFFAAALGVYPHLNIMDAAFAIRIGERQYNLHASRHLGMERMDTEVGPIRVEVIEPLKRLRLAVKDPEHGIEADLVFEGRHFPIEEPRCTRRSGSRMLMDVTRMTQLGRWSGRVRVGGRQIDLQHRQVFATRDRSWGVRPIGERDPQPIVPTQPPQIHWIWIPATLEDRVMLYYLNHDGDGVPWNYGMMMCRDDGTVEHFAGAMLDLTLAPGTRWPARASLSVPHRGGGHYRIDVEAGPKFFMSGIGYMNPDWGHGMHKGPLQVAYDEISLAEVTRYEAPHHHVQAFSHVEMTTPEGRLIKGVGAFEMLSVGDYRPLGLTGMFDAP